MELAEEIVLLDIKEGFAEGKAMDMNQTANLHGFKSKVHGVTNNYAATAGSKVVVITSGIPRKPGMTRCATGAFLRVSAHRVPCGWCSGCPGAVDD